MNTKTLLKSRTLWLIGAALAAVPLGYWLASQSEVTDNTARETVEGTGGMTINNGNTVDPLTTLDDVFANLNENDIIFSSGGGTTYTDTNGPQGHGIQSHGIKGGFRGNITPNVGDFGPAKGTVRALTEAMEGGNSQVRRIAAKALAQMRAVSLARGDLVLHNFHNRFTSTKAASKNALTATKDEKQKEATIRGDNGSRINISSKPGCRSRINITDSGGFGVNLKNDIIGTVIVLVADGTTFDNPNPKRNQVPQRKPQRNDLPNQNNQLPQLPKRQDLKPQRNRNYINKLTSRRANLVSSFRTGKVDDGVKRFNGVGDFPPYPIPQQYNVFPKPNKQLIPATYAPQKTTEQFLRH